MTLIEPRVPAPGTEAQQIKDIMKENMIVMGGKALRAMVMTHAERELEWWFGKPGGDGGWEKKYDIIRALPDAGNELGHERGECHEKLCQICNTLEAIEIDAKMQLIGATCLEDQLQDLVPECIEDFLLAKVKVWMLTGDKLPTAKNIGMACNLIDPVGRCWLESLLSVRLSSSLILLPLSSFPTGYGEARTLDETSEGYVPFDVCHWSMGCSCH